MLEDFVNKIFGPGKKLGSLIIFTLCLLVISSGISMQLFCFLCDFSKFETFPEVSLNFFFINFKYIFISYPHFRLSCPCFKFLLKRPGLMSWMKLCYVLVKHL